MRVSNQTKILDAARVVLERDGITGLTFDAVAAESGITRGGIIYHFKSRDELVAAINAHLAGKWEAELQAELRDVAEPDADDRLVAYVRTCAYAASRAEVQLAMAPPPVGEPSPWHEVFETWTPAPAVDDDAGVVRLIARLAADGLWFHDAITREPLTTEARERVIEAIAVMIGRPQPPADDDGAS